MKTLLGTTSALLTAVILVAALHTRITAPDHSIISGGALLTALPRETRTTIHPQLALPAGFSLVGTPLLSGGRVLLQGRAQDGQETLFLWEEGAGLSALTGAPTFSALAFAAEGQRALFLSTEQKGELHLYWWEEGFGARPLLKEPFAGQWTSSLALDGRTALLLPQSPDARFLREGIEAGQPITLDLTPVMLARNGIAQQEPVLTPLPKGLHSTTVLSPGSAILSKRVRGEDGDGDGASKLFLFSPPTAHSPSLLPTFQAMKDTTLLGANGVGVPPNVSTATWRFGDPDGVPVLGDYNGDGVLDIATYSNRNTTDWQIALRSPLLHSAATGFLERQTPGERGLPAPGDYDGKGGTDLAVYSPKSFGWWISYAEGNHTELLLKEGPTDRGVRLKWGEAGAYPVVGDYDGDKKTDLALFSPGRGERRAVWRILRDRDTKESTVIDFGREGDVPVPADYDGDGKTEIAVYRPSTQTWLLRNSDSETTTIPFGSPAGEPLTGDFDGDGRADLCIFTPGRSHQWQFLLSSLPPSHPPLTITWGRAPALPPQLLLRQRYLSTTKSLTP